MSEQPAWFNALIPPPDVNSFPAVGFEVIAPFVLMQAAIKEGPTEVTDAPVFVFKTPTPLFILFATSKAAVPLPETSQKNTDLVVETPEKVTVKVVFPAFEVNKYQRSALKDPLFPAAFVAWVKAVVPSVIPDIVLLSAFVAPMTMRRPAPVDVTVIVAVLLLVVFVVL